MSGDLILRGLQRSQPRRREGSSYFSPPSASTNTVIIEQVYARPRRAFECGGFTAGGGGFPSGLWGRGRLSSRNGGRPRIEKSLRPFLSIPHPWWTQARRGW